MIAALLVHRLEASKMGGATTTAGYRKVWLGTSVIFEDGQIVILFEKLNGILNRAKAGGGKDAVCRRQKHT